MKKIIAVLLAMTIAFSIPSVAFASEDIEQTTAVTEENIPSVEENDAPPVEEETDNNDGPVATLYLCSSITLWPIVGHSYIYVENNSDKPITVGLYEVPVGQGVSVGSFSFSVRDGFGIYYNLEAYRENAENTMKKIWSISEELDENELQKLTKSLKSYPNYWGFGANCATFAFSMWNSVTGDLFFSLLIPAITEMMIIIAGGKKGNVNLYYPERDQIFRQKGTGENAYLQVASDHTV